MADKRCVDCGCAVKHGPRCRSCASIVRWAPNGACRKRFPKQPDRHCVDCGIKLRGSHSPQRCHSCEQERRWSDKEFRKRHSQGCAQAALDNPELIRGRSERAKHQHQSGGTLSFMRGPAHPNWSGGKNWYGPGIDEFRLEIRILDDYTCAICGLYGKVVHHIDQDKLNNTLDNCITLCISCHMRIHRNKEWKDVLIGFSRRLESDERATATVP